MSTRRCPGWGISNRATTPNSASPKNIRPSVVPKGEKGGGGKKNLKPTSPTPERQGGFVQGEKGEGTLVTEREKEDCGRLGKGKEGLYLQVTTGTTIPITAKKEKPLVANRRRAFLLYRRIGPRSSVARRDKESDQGKSSGARSGRITIGTDPRHQNAAPDSTSEGEGKVRRTEINKGISAWIYHVTNS